jgi:hypothetical protein
MLVLPYEFFLFFYDFTKINSRIQHWQKFPRTAVLNDGWVPAAV